MSLCSCANSSTPSEKDIERNLSNLFKECKYVEILNVKKLDGMPQPDGAYLVKTTFDINIEPIDENIKLWEEYSEKLSKYKFFEQELKDESEKSTQAWVQMKREFENKMQASTSMEKRDSIIEWERAEQDRIDSENQQIATRHFAKLKEAGLTTFDSSGNEIFRKQGQIFDRQCPIRNTLGKTLIFKAVPLLDSANKRVEILGNGGLTSFSYDIKMIKTENGWQLNF